MYERFFNLRERPFALSPDPDYLYPSRVHREALGYLRYGIESQAGFVVITGEIGSGKTTLLQALLRGLDGQTTVIRLMNTLLEPRELLEAIAIDLGIEPAAASKPALLRDVATRLVEERTAGRLVLLVVDEAQNLSLAALEEVRMLSNLETEKSKLIQVVLVGQPDLRDTLNLPTLQQLRQRITVSYHLAALDPGETEAYINHRLRRASLGAPLEFKRDVTDRIHERARGVPRLVNVICDAALVFAYADERHVVDRPLVEEALQELEATGVLLAPGTDGRAETTEPLRPAEAVLPRAAEVAEPPMDLTRVQEVIAREAMLRAREEHVQRREEQLAEQRRVLAEEYRLFRARQNRELTLATVQPLPDAASPGWPPAPASAASLHEAAAPEQAPMAPTPMWPQAHQPPASRLAESQRAWPGATPRPAPASYRPTEWRPEAPPRRRFWRRVKQVLLGSPEPVLEDRP